MLSDYLSPSVTKCLNYSIYIMRWVSGKCVRCKDAHARKYLAAIKKIVDYVKSNQI